jgi:two-component sensor histidine kinase
VRYPYISAGRGDPVSEPAVASAAAGDDQLAQLIHPDDRAAWIAAFAVASNPEPCHLEVRTVPDGKFDGGTDERNMRWLRVMARQSPQPATGGGRVWDGVALDVTDLKEIQDRLAGALEESQTLLAEVHHRVKNNLQVVWSLVQLEAMQIDYPAARARMEIIGQRINVMGRIHEQIYAHKEFTRIDFTLQLRTLAERLVSASSNHAKVDLEVTGERLFCSLDTAIPMALIANELISNVVAHAFPPAAFAPGMGGTLRIGLRRHGDGAVMTIADNGVGMPSGPLGDGAGGKGLGMRLVKALISQLCADMTLDQPESAPKDTFDPGPDPSGGTRGTRVTIIVPGPWYADD